MTQKDMKFRVKDEAHSKAIQEKLFEMGIGWSGRYFNVSHTDKSFLYTAGESLMYGTAEYVFDEDHSIEHVLTKDSKIVPLVDNDGYIYWNGGECPVPEGTLVDVKYYSGHVEKSIPALVGNCVNPGQKFTAYSWENGLGPGTIVACKLTEKQSAVEAPQAAKQGPPTLRPQKEMWLDRAAELLAAMSLCVDNQQKIPYEWIEELANVNVHL